MTSERLGNTDLLSVERYELKNTIRWFCWWIWQSTWQSKQWRIKGGADWATARSPQHLGGPQSVSRKKVYYMNNTQYIVKDTIANKNY